MNGQHTGTHLRLALALCFLGFTPRMAQAYLLGVDLETGSLYRVSTDDASLTLIGHTGVPLAGLEWSPAGQLYGYTTGATPSLYIVDPLQATAIPVGPLGSPIFVFEGGLAFAPDGTAFGINMGEETANSLFLLNLQTGQASAVALLDGAHDVNGLAWRSDGMLVGLDQAMNALIQIDPVTGATAVIRELSDLNVNGISVLGSNGGMTVVGGTGYFSTANTGATLPGSNELYAFDLFTGQTEWIGTFSPGLSPKGLGGLAVPEPGTCCLALLLGGWLARRRCWEWRAAGTF